MVGFVVFFLLCLPIMWIRPELYKIPFLVASAVIIPTMLAILIWAVVAAPRGGALFSNTEGVTGIKQAQGTHLVWQMVFGIMSILGPQSSHLFGQSDYTRFARKPKDQILAQILFVPFNNIVVALIGIVCTSCATQIFLGQETALLWQPYDLLAAIQKHFNNSSGSRAAVAFASLAFICAQLGIAIAANMLVNGIDLAALAPRWFDIRRGGYFTAIFAFIMQPWDLLNGASKFLTVVGGFAVFIGPLTGIVFADYYFVRRRLLKLTSLYDLSSNSIYWYTKGFIWRAPVAWISGFWSLMPGFVHRVQDPSVELAGWTKLYYMTYPVGILFALITYLALDYFWLIEYKVVEDDEDYFGTFNELSQQDYLDGVAISREGQQMEIQIKQ